jgi:hypothetical protein
LALYIHRANTITVTRYDPAEKCERNSIKVAATHINAVLIDHFSLNQINAGTRRIKSYALALGAQNREAVIASDKSGIFGK